MQVIPLLFINNWPGPSVGAIYRADCCFAREHKLLELYFFAFSDYLTENHIKFSFYEASYKLLDLWLILFAPKTLLNIDICEVLVHTQLFS